MTEQSPQMQRTRTRARRRDARQFGAVVTTAAVIASAYLWHRGLPWWAQAAVGLAALMLVLTVMAPMLLMPLRRVWMRLAGLLGWLNMHLLLGVAFYSLFTLIGCIMRWTGYDPLRRGLDPDRGSYWQLRSSPQTPREQFERQF